MASKLPGVPIPAKIASSSAILSVPEHEVGDQVDIARAQRGGEGEAVRTAPAVQIVDASAAVDHIGAVIAGHVIVELVAGQVDRGGGGVVDGAQHLDRKSRDERVIGARVEDVEALAGKFDDDVVHVGEIAVVALAAPQDIRAAAAMERVRARIAGDVIVERVAEEVDRRRRGLVDRAQHFDRHADAERDSCERA